MNQPNEPPYWVGFDLGGTKMLANVFDAEFRSLGRKRKKTSGHKGAKAGLERIANTIDQALDSAGVKRGQIGGIGIGCPGPLDLENGVILEAPNLGWESVPVTKSLEKEFGCPVAIMNDVDAGLFGEYRFGAAQSARCVVGVFPGTGIGGACVYQGEIVSGKKTSCLEVGHIRVVADGPLCGCGRRGCLEAVASRLAISAAAAQAAFRGQAPNLLKDTGTDLADIRSGALASAIKKGDDTVKQIVLTASGYIGTAIGGLVNLLAPDIVVVGGGLAEALEDVLVPAVESAARQAALPSMADSFKVVAATLGDDAAIQGAAARIRQHVERDG